MSYFSGGILTSRCKRLGEEMRRELSVSYSVYKLLRLRNRDGKDLWQKINQVENGILQEISQFLLEKP